MNSYMPTGFMQSMSRHAFLGAVVVLNSILTRLEADQTPCPNKVEEAIYGMDAISFYHAFVDNGGKVEHLLDCLIQWAKNESEISTSIDDETPSECREIPILDKDFDLVRLMCLHGESR